MRRFHSRRSSFSTGPSCGSAMPALFTSASSRPKRFTTARTQARTAASRDTSVRDEEEIRCAAQVGNRDLPAQAGEGERDAAADALRAAGDERHFFRGVHGDTS